MLTAIFISLASCRCDVFVMAPLDLMNNNQEPTYFDKFSNWCSQLKNGNIDGVMIDIWWGLVETSPRNYKWDGYNRVFKVMKEKNLKIIPVLSFHKCGGNVGDNVNIPIPSFVFSNQVKPYFVDRQNQINDEYISFSYDTIKVGDRTPLEMYRDFMLAFCQNFQEYLDSNTIVEIEVGLGPCGELRYPSYLLSRWTYPACGAFQSYDQQFKEYFKKDAAAAGHPEWNSPPTDTGDYYSYPGSSSFWSNGFKSDFGKFYQEWYAKQLIDHGSNVLRIAREVFTTTRLSAKISGIHWQFMTECRCAEATAGFYMSNGHDGYKDIVEMFKRHNVDVCFTCLEMTGQDQSAKSDPGALVNKILQVTKQVGLHFEGENALERYDWGAYNQILYWASQGLSAFTYLRMTDTLMNSYDNWNAFTNFANQMHNK
ncbi:beta-amylase [Tritrichomonas musculus]|uniref:Beta-amylase n=1 Tax=Tritrichomonas musculus TaxID=1915356 RepID=A0ABR2I5V7_9EUKA